MINQDSQSPLSGLTSKDRELVERIAAAKDDVWVPVFCEDGQWHVQLHGDKLLSLITAHREVGG